MTPITEATPTQIMFHRQHQLRQQRLAETEGARKKALQRLAEAEEAEIASALEQDERQAAQEKDAIEKAGIWDSWFAKAWSVLSDANNDLSRKRAGVDGITMEMIILDVCFVFDVDRLDLLSQRRFAKLILPRKLVCYLCRHFTTRSYPGIGRKLGNRDHTTIMHAVRSATKLLKIDPAFAAKAAPLIAKYEAMT